MRYAVIQCRLAKLIFNPVVGLGSRAPPGNGPPRYIYGVSGVLVASCLKLSFRHFCPEMLLGVLSGVYHRKVHPIMGRAGNV